MGWGWVVCSKRALHPNRRGWLVGFVLWAIAVGTVVAVAGIRSVSAADLQRALLALILTGLFLGGMIVLLHQQWYVRTYWIAFVAATMVVALDTSRAHVETFLLSFVWIVYWIQSKRVSRTVIRPSVDASGLQAG